MLENSRGRKSTEIPTTTTTTMTTANPLSFRKWFQTDECMKINSHQKQHSVSSSSLERNWNKNLQIYYIINNLSTLCVLILLSKCVYSLYPSITAIILFISSYTFATVFSISSIYFTSVSSSSISLTTKYQLVEYIKNTPLSYLTFYYFTRLNCLKSTNSFDYNLLMLATVYFSVQTVVNCVLIEIRPSSLLRLRCIQILFLFIFRYFAFLAKLISVVLLYATLTDSTFIAVLRSSVDLDSLELALTKHIHSLTFLFLATCLVSFAVWHIFKSTRRRLSTNLNNCIGEAVFESYKLMIEYNETLVHGWTTRVFYMCVQFFMHIVAAYFWYYRAVIVLAKARAKTTLIGLLTRQNHLRVLMDLYELEEKLKTRQFEVVCVLGSLLISFLSSHIYYSYYKIDDHDEDEEESKSKETLRRRMTGRYVNSAQGRPSVFQIESVRGGEDTVSSKDGSFMIHAENSQMSGSVSSWIASSVSSSSSSGIFNPNSYYNNNHHHKQMDCSTCCTSIDRYIFDDVFADSMLSTGDACQIAHGKIPHADFMFACPIRTGLDYDSSSGLASSATSTSISSIYEEFASEWNTLPHISPPRGAANRFTLNQATLSRHPVVLIPSTPIAAPPQPANIYDKVMLWIKNQEKSSIRPPVLTETTTTTATTTMTTICDMTNWQPRTSSTVNADHMVTNSLVHTDSTSKTDQSNFTYFI